VCLFSTGQRAHLEIAIEDVIDGLAVLGEDQVVKGESARQAEEVKAELVGAFTEGQIDLFVAVAIGSGDGDEGLLIPGDVANLGECGRCGGRPVE
jgi:hypothetical protein